MHIEKRTENELKKGWMGGWRSRGRGLWVGGDEYGDLGRVSL